MNKNMNAGKERKTPPGAACAAVLASVTVEFNTSPPAQNIFARQNSQNDAISWTLNPHNMLSGTLAGSTDSTPHSLLNDAILYGKRFEDNVMKRQNVCGF